MQLVHVNEAYGRLLHHCNMSKSDERARIAQYAILTRVYLKNMMLEVRVFISIAFLTSFIFIRSSKDAMEIDVQSLSRVVLVCKNYSDQINHTKQYMRGNISDSTRILH